MHKRSKGVATALLLAMTLAGCTSARFGGFETARAPTPLNPAPTGVVTTDPLPPPATPSTSDPTRFPDAPTGPEVSTSDPTRVAANAPDVTVGSVAGVWNASVSGQGCRIATPQTRFGQGFRAGPLRCPTPLDGVKSWNVEGKQLALYDENGQVLARLYSSGAERFDGQTSSGQPVALTR